MKFLVIGPGLIGRQHIQLILDHEECTVEAIVALHPEKHKNYTNELNIKVYGSLDDAFDNHEFDAAIVSSPNEKHYEHAIQCIDRDIPVLVEKPLTDTLERAESLEFYANKKNIPILVGHHRTYSSFIPIAKQIIQSREFGRLVSVQGSAQFYKPKHYFTEGVWRTKKGGGPILINLIHEIGIMRELCGEIRKVFAISSNDVRDFEVEDTVAITLEFQNSCLGTFILSDCSASTKSWEMTSGENPAYPHYPEDACYHITGTNGSLDFPSMNLTYYKDKNNASWWEPFEHKKIEVQAENPLRSQLEHFVSVIKGESSPIVCALSGYKNMKVLDAINRSILEEAVIYL